MKINNVASLDDGSAKILSSEIDFHGCLQFTRIIDKWPAFIDHKNRNKEKKGCELHFTLCRQKIRFN